MLKPLRKAFFIALEAEGWTRGFRFGDFPRMGRTLAAVTIDAAKSFDCEECGHRHRILLEMCTDNRQAILGNLIKLEFAGRRFLANYPQGFVCAVGLFVSQERKESLAPKGFIDNSVGTLEEYEIQASGPWQGLLTNSFLALTL